MVDIDRGHVGRGERDGHVWRRLPVGIGYLDVRGIGWIGVAGWVVTLGGSVMWRWFHSPVVGDLTSLTRPVPECAKKVFAL